MTEHEYTIEMLCCTPLELLDKRLAGDCDEIPVWLTKIPQSDVQEARALYFEPSYAKIRDDMLREMHADTIVMLCCTPLELLDKRLAGDCDEIPVWLTKIPQSDVREARALYFEPSYAKIRDDMLQEKRP